MVFREAFTRDIAGMQNVRVSVTENKISDPNLLPPKMYAQYINEIGKGWVCEIAGEIVGFSIASLRDRSIWALFVKPDYEAQGIGKQLLKLATDWLFENGASVISLSTSVDTRADLFYQIQGWKRGQLRANGEVDYSLEMDQR
jgi:GNAT superfamily N-acetyltransferase